MKAATLSSQPLCNQFGTKLSFGSEILGIDLSKSLSAEEWEYIENKLEQDSLLLFRNQRLTPEQELDFMTRFPHDKKAVKERRNVAPFFKKLKDYHPLLSLHGYGSFNHYGEEINFPVVEQFKYAKVWHTDFNSISDTPPVLTAMYSVFVPKKGGETLFCSAVKAYELLPQTLQQKALKIKVQYCPGINFQTDPEGRRRIDDIKASMSNFNPPKFGRVQPAVIKTKNEQKALFLSSHSAAAIEGMDIETSQQLFEQLLTPGTQPEHIFSLQWQVGDFIIWNNREILHTHTPSHVYENDRRLLHIIFLDSQEKVFAG